MPEDKNNKRGLNEDAIPFEIEGQASTHLEQWLENDVAPVYDRLEANPDEAISLRDAMTRIRAGLDPN